MTTLEPIPDEGSVSQSDPNLHTIDAVISSIQSSIYSTSATGQYGSADPRTELDSHANMVVLGKHSFIFESSGRTCNVSPFAKELGIASNVPIVDGAIAYDCPTTKETYILIVRNALYMPSMDLNLIPPFIMRAGGVQVNEVPKIHCDDPTSNDHCISFKDIDLRIPLQLFGTFSYFHTRKPMPQELHDKDKVFITPDASDWNPHCESFERNERAMLNYEGEMNDPIRRTNEPMQLSPDDSDIFELNSVSADSWNSHIDATISSMLTILRH